MKTLHQIRPKTRKPGTLYKLMTHDFAKIRPEPILDTKPVAPPPAWSLMFTGVVVGAALGIFGCVLFYLSGNVPPLAGQESSIALAPQGVQAEELPGRTLPNPEQTQDTSGIAEIEAPTEEVPEPQDLEFEFYEILPNNEVMVAAEPVELTDEQSQRLNPVSPPVDLEAQRIAAEIAQSEPLQGNYMLQSGAFQQVESANTQRTRLETLGLQTTVKQQNITGRTLYLVQTGPFATQGELSQAEALLRSANINSMRISLR